MSDWHWVYDIAKRQITGTIQPSVFQQRVSAAKSIVQHFELEHKLEYHNGCVNSLHFNENGSLLVSGSDDLKVVLWDWQKKKPVVTFISDHHENVFQAKFMPLCCDRVIVSAARDGQIFKTVLSCDGELRENKRVASHRGAAHKLALLSGDPHVFLSCGEDAVVYEIDLREDQPHKLVTVRGEEKHRKVPLYTIFSNPANINEFATAGRDQYARVYDRRKIVLSDESVEPLKLFYPNHLNGGDHSENITCLVYSYDGRELLCSYNDEDIYLFDSSHSSGSEHIKKYRGHRNNATVKGINFYGPKSEYVVSGSDCGHIFLWDKDTSEVVQFLCGDEAGVVNCLEPHPNCPVLATSGLDHEVKIWSPTANEATDLDGLEMTMSSNEQEREEEKQIPRDPVSERLFRMLMRHAHHAHHRQMRDREGEEDSSDSSSDDSSDESDDDESRPSITTCHQT